MDLIYKNYIMKANGLRINNIVYYNGNKKEVGKITGFQSTVTMQSYVYLDNRVNNTLDLDEIKPIPLTEDWLLKFGYFIVKTNGTLEATLPNFRYIVQTAKEYDGFFFCDEENVLTNFRYVHQLQNLYFALTGEELIINENL